MIIRLDYISCVLTILSTVLVGKNLWQGWLVAGANSIIICFMGVRTAQFGFVPANLFCIALYSYNLWSWRKVQRASSLGSLTSAFRYVTAPTCSRSWP